MKRVVVQAVLIVTALSGILFVASQAMRRGAQRAGSTPRVPPIQPGEEQGVSSVRSFPHDPAAFTQGLVIADGILHEGTGLVGRSSLRRVLLETGSILASRPLPAGLFGEGITVLNGKVYQLTWRARRGFVHDAETLELLGEFSYPTEGWGLTHDGAHLILSDGTDVLTRIDPVTFEILGRTRVTYHGRPVEWLNELEYVEGEVLANIADTHFIAVIDPATGFVRTWLNLAGLFRHMPELPPEAVANGIAYDAAAGRLFLTGKLWPALFEVDARF